jgi:hypothetical protein
MENRKIQTQRKLKIINLDIPKSKTEGKRNRGR